MFDVETSENWMRDTVRFGVQTDGFSCGFYVLAAMRTTSKQTTIMPAFNFLEYNADTSEAIRDSCKERNVRAIIHCAGTGGGEPLTDERAFRHVGNMSSSMKCLENMGENEYCARTERSVESSDGSSIMELVEDGVRREGNAVSMS